MHRESIFIDPLIAVVKFMHEIWFLSPQSKSRYTTNQKLIMSYI